MARPILTGPLHRRDWRAFGRRCTCGLRWRCPDSRQVPAVAEPVYVRAVGVVSAPRPTWAPVAQPQTTRDAGRPARVAGNPERAGLLTLAGEWRGNGGRWSR